MCRYTVQGNRYSLQFVDFRTKYFYIKYDFRNRSEKFYSRISFHIDNYLLLNAYYLIKMHYKAACTEPGSHRVSGDVTPIT